MTFGDDVIRAIRGTLTFASLGLERDAAGRWIVDGRELRARDGVDVLPPARLNGVTIDSVRFRGIGWSDVEVIDARVVGCVFDRCRLESWYIEATRWQDCDFRKTCMREFGMSGARKPWARQTMWERTSFRDADLRGTFHGTEIYRGCDFSNAKLDRVDFEGSVHIGSLFAGLVNDVTFRRRPHLARSWRRTSNAMEGVDFREARLEFCGFWDLDLRSVALPRDPAHLVYRPKVQTAMKVLSRLPAEPSQSWSAGLRAAMERHILEGPGNVDALGIIDVSTLPGTREDRHRATTLIRDAAEWAVGGET